MRAHNSLACFRSGLGADALALRRQAPTVR